MAKILPFKAIRPKEGKEKEIAALPYDVYSRLEAKQEVARNPLSFLAIDRAETQFADTVSMYDDCVYQKARELLLERIKTGDLIQEEQNCYYIYELTMNGRSQTGIVACASIDEYLDGTIKKHENTRADKELDRIKHVDACGAQTGPIFLAYRAHPLIHAMAEEIKKEIALYDFTATDQITHRVWRIKDTAQKNKLEQAFGEVERIYIADGHHRCASAVKVSLKKREENKNHTGEEPYNYFLSVLFPDDQLMILDYNRVIADLNGMSAEAFLRSVAERFVVEEKGSIPYHPEKKGCFGMYLEEMWYKLTLRKEKELTQDPVKGLDVTVLQEELLYPLLGIADPKTDKRIDFVGGIRGLSELEQRVRLDAAVAFALYPTSMHELFAVADAGCLMPPKSTWFEPKLRSGLFIHSITDEMKEGLSYE